MEQEEGVQRQSEKELLGNQMFDKIKITLLES